MPQNQLDRTPVFFCLDPRKTKHKLVDTTLSGVGRIRWIKIPRIRIKGWRETDARIEKALNSSKTKPRSFFMRYLKRQLLRMQYNGTRAMFSKKTDAVAVAWNGLNSSRMVFMDAARDAGAKTLFFELSPLSGRITVDPCGVNFRNSLPRSAAPYLEWFRATNLEPEKWREAGNSIQQRTSKKSNAEASHTDTPDLSEPFLFVPLQVPGDSQLRLFGGEYRTVENFIEALARCAAHLPKGWHLRIKEHPTSETSFADKIRSISRARVFLDNTTDTFKQVAASRAVITVNSSVGLEAMYYDKPVVATGACFWTVPGVAIAAPTQKDLIAVFTNPEKIAFDPDVRRAFLSFLNEEYYPAVTGDAQENQKIVARLNGKDQLGFWGCMTSRSAK